ncbi:MAG: hypothetical protein IT449_07790 [Phycisphaerales bacterium]|nr:hypothetical protein [Phycisphaerales bacterium]
MIRIQILGEGSRDEAAAPPLVENLLGRRISAAFTAWSSPSIQRFHQKGLSKLGRRLLYVLARASADGVQGVVAIIDGDQLEGERLAALKAGRRRHREKYPPIPTALGCAIPHFEAWLIDDPVAVREVLRLPADCEVSSPTRTSSPKLVLHALFTGSPRASEDLELAVLPEIARRFQLERCNQRNHTGLADFAKDLRAAFREVIGDSSAWQPLT